MPDEDADLPGLEQMPPGDQAAIGDVMMALLGGFAGRDVGALADAYAQDADWVNAFGTALTGRDAILSYLRGLFADANFDAGRIVAPPESRLRRLSDTVVAVSVHLQVRDQGLVGGGSITLRDNRSLHILQKERDGRWRIVSEIYMDARQDSTYAR